MPGQNTRRSEEQEIARGNGGFWHRRPNSPFVIGKPLKPKRKLPKMLGVTNNQDWFTDWN